MSHLVWEAFLKELVPCIGSAGAATLHAAERVNDAASFKAAMEDCMQQAQNLLVCHCAPVNVQHEFGKTGDTGDIVHTFCQCCTILVFCSALCLHHDSDNSANGHITSLITSTSSLLARQVSSNITTHDVSLSFSPANLCPAGNVCHCQALWYRRMQGRLHGQQKV